MITIPHHIVDNEEREKYRRIKERMLGGELVSRKDFLFKKSHDQRANALKGRRPVKWKHSKGPRVYLGFNTK